MPKEPRRIGLLSFGLRKTSDILEIQERKRCVMLKPDIRISHFVVRCWVWIGGFGDLGVSTSEHSMNIAASIITIV